MWVLPEDALKTVHHPQLHIPSQLLHLSYFSKQVKQLPHPYQYALLVMVPGKKDTLARNYLIGLTDERLQGKMGERALSNISCSQGGGGSIVSQAHAHTLSNLT